MRALLLTLALPLAAQDPWTKPQMALATATASVIVMDWGQTLDIATRPPRPGHIPYDEQNPILGRRPTVAQVNTYFAISMLSTAAIAEALPSRWRTWYLAWVTTFELAWVRHNYSIGLRCKF